MSNGTRHGETLTTVTPLLAVLMLLATQLSPVLSVLFADRSSSGVNP